MPQCWAHSCSGGQPAGSWGLRPAPTTPMAPGAACMVPVPGPEDSGSWTVSAAQGRVPPPQKETTDTLLLGRTLFPSTQHLAARQLQPCGEQPFTTPAPECRSRPGHKLRAQDEAPGCSCHPVRHTRPSLQQGLAAPSPVPAELEGSSFRRVQASALTTSGSIARQKARAEESPRHSAACWQGPGLMPGRPRALQSAGLEGAALGKTPEAWSLSPGAWSLSPGEMLHFEVR